MGQGLAEFIAVLIPSSATALVMYALFCFCRHRNLDVYEPRTRKVMPKLERPSQPSPPGLLGWIMPLMRLKLEDLARNSGTDAAARVAFQSTMAIVFIVMSVPICGMLLPIYFTAGGSYTDFDQFTMANIHAEGSWRFWVAAITCWPASLVVYFVIYSGLGLVASLRVSEEKRLCKFHHQVVVTRSIPEGSRSVEAVAKHFEELYPGNVLYVQPIKDLGKSHEKLFGEYVKSWRGWKKAMAINKTKPDGEKCMVKTGFLGLVGKKVEAVPYHRGKCEEHKEKLEERTGEYDSIEGWHTAFVAFGNSQSAASALTSFNPRKAWGCSPAPHPREIYWPNMRKGRSLSSEAVRAGVAALLAAAVVLAFAPVLAATEALCNLEELSRSVSWLTWISDVPASVRGLLQGLLPVLVVIVMNAIVLPIMELLAVLSGAETLKVLHRRVMWYFFVHLLFNCCLVVVVSSSLFKSIKDIIDDPSLLGSLLGSSIPKVSTFFILYIMARSFGGPPGQLALLPKVLLGRLKVKYLAKTDFEKEEAVEPAFHDLGIGAFYAFDLFVCVVCMSYSIIAPMVSVFGLLYFLLDIVTSKYLLNFHWKTSFNSGGALAVSAFRGSCIGVMVGQLVTVCTLSLEGHLGAAVVAPLPVLSFIIAAILPYCGPGRIACREGPLQDCLAELEDAGACIEGSGNLKEVQAANHWCQPSFAPHFDDPVRDRFNWVPSHGGPDYTAGGFDAVGPV